MTSEILTTESKWLVVSNLPDTATEETIKECFERHGGVQSIKIDNQHFAFVAFWDIRTASKAHYAENILDKQQLKTAFSDGSNSIPKILLEPSPINSSIIEPSSSSPSSITTMTNTLIDKTMVTIQEDRDKRTARSQYSPEESTRHQVVPIEHNSDSSKNKRKTSSNSNSKSTKVKSTRRKHDTSSSSSDSHSSLKHHSSKFKRQLSKTKILKIYHLPSKMSNQSLREALRNIFLGFKRSSHLLNIKIIDDYALLAFRKSEDVDKALSFINTKSINGIRLKAESYDGSIPENEDYDLVKRPICSDLDLDEYSVKATRTLYIGNLPAEISYQELREIYSAYGEIIEIEIKRQQPQHSQIFAFIQYADIKSVVKVFKSKIIHNHSLKFGFGKSQPTNVLWLDNLPLDITELMLRSFLTRFTNLPANEILDIYIDDQNSQKTQTTQCLIYFIDTIAAQTAINGIRGKKLDTKRIQVDFASRVFLTRFSDIIEHTNQNKNSDRWINQSYRRYSKISDTSSTGIRNSTRRHSSASSSTHSSINQKKLIKSETDKHANTERIFDWLMQSHHSSINDHEEEHHPEEQVSNVKIIETKKESKDVPSPTKKIFQTKIIPLESDSSVVQTDIRLKIYSSQNDRSIKSICLPFPNFAKTLIKSSHRSMILNPKAYLKHSLTEDLSINKELDERIKLLDKQIQISSSVLSSTMATSSLISPPLCNDISNTNLSIKPLERLDSAITLKYKPIPPPLSVITTLPSLANTNESPIYPTPKSITPSSVLSSHHQSPVTIFSPVSKQQPTVLKSILKPPSNNLSQSTPNETRKAVHIVSTKSPLESTVKSPLEEKKKPITPRPVETKKFKLIETIKKPLKVVKKVPIVTKPTPVVSKTSKIINKPPEITKKPLTIPTKNRLPNNEPLKTKSQPSLTKPSVINMKKPEQKPPNPQNKIFKKPINGQPKKKLTLKQTSCMYDRIKARARAEQSQNSLFPVKDEATQPLKRKNVVAESGESEGEKSVKKKKSWIFDSEIFDTGENEDKKMKQPQIITSKFKKKEFILKKKLKRKKSDPTNQPPKIQNEQTIKLEISSINDVQSVTMISKKDEQPVNLIDSIQSEELPQESSSQKEQCSIDKPPAVELPVDIPPEKTLIPTDQSPTIATNPSMTKDKLISTSLSDITKSSCFSLPTTNEPTNLFDSRSISHHKHSSTPLYPFPQIHTPDSTIFNSTHQHFPYPLFAPPPPDSPPLSTRTRSTSSCSSIIGNPLYNTILQQQHCYDKDSRRESLSKLSTASSQYIGSDSTGSLRSSSDIYGYPPNAQQMLNSYANELYRMNDISSSDPYDIQWEGHIILKTDQAYIKTQLIAGNSQIARITMNYWSTDLNHNLRICQRMRLEEIQIDGVKKHMQMDNDYCMLIAEPNGITPDEIRLEQNNLKIGLIQYLSEKKAAGILNIHLPGVLQPVYVAHIFPPCQFATEILQKRAPDAYRCVVQNKSEEIYLLFIITSTIQ